MRCSDSGFSLMTAVPLLRLCAVGHRLTFI
jgi:hypothetical protein